MTPRKTGVAEIGTFEPLKQGEAFGFKATLDDGSEITYLAAPDRSAAMKIGDVQVDAEALLYQESPGRSPKGIVIKMNCAFFLTSVCIIY